MEEAENCDPIWGLKAGFKRIFDFWFPYFLDFCVNPERRMNIDYPSWRAWPQSMADCYGTRMIKGPLV